MVLWIRVGDWRLWGWGAAGVVGAAPLVDRVGEVAEAAGQIGAAGGVPDGSALFFDGEEALPGEVGEVAGDDGEIDAATLGDLGDRAGTAALDEAGEEFEAGGVGEGLEEVGIEAAINGGPASDSLTGGGGLDESGGIHMLGYLCHRASIHKGEEIVKYGGIGPGLQDQSPGLQSEVVSRTCDSADKHPD